MFLLLGVIVINPKNTFWRLLKYSLQFKYSYFVLFLTMIIGVGSDLVIAWYLSQVTNTAVANGQVWWQVLVIIGLIILLVNVGNSYADTYFKTRISSKIRNNLRIDTMKKLLCLPASHYNNNHSGELLSRITNDNQVIGHACTNTLIALIRNPLLAVLSFIYLLTIHWKLALICMLIGPMTILVGALFSKALRNNSQVLQSEIGKMTSLLQEILGSSIIFKTFGLEKKLHDKFVNSSNVTSQLEMQGGRIHATLSATANGVGHFSFIITFILGAVFVSNGSMTIGGLIAFIQLMNHLTWPFTSMASLWGEFQKALGAADRIFKIMDEQSEFMSLPEQLVSNQQGYLSVSDLTFGYKEDQVVLNNIGFSVKPGEVIAIVGPSGSGKSTIFSLLLGLFKPNFGRIRINDINTTALNLEVARSYFALVPQENYLYSGTVRENIANGKLDATDDEIISAAKDANALDFIMKLPDGFESEIGEGGAYLSGGQKQRISIARALLRDAPILLLDEATASLDSESESLVQEALARLMKGRTTVVIAHRLATIRNANEIIVLDNGEIMEKGTHEELLKSEGLYCKLLKGSYSNTLES